jgi:hypothetical protein
MKLKHALRKARRTKGPRVYDIRLSKQGYSGFPHAKIGKLRARVDASVPLTAWDFWRARQVP